MHIALTDERKVIRYCNVCRARKVMRQRTGITLGSDPQRIVSLACKCGLRFQVETKKLKVLPLSRV